MATIKNILIWIARKGILWIALAAALLSYAIWSSGDIKSVVLKEPEFHLGRAGLIDAVADKVEQERKDAEAGLVSLGKWANEATVSELENELNLARKQRAKLIAEVRSGPRALLSALTLDGAALLRDRQRDVQIAAVERKIVGLEKALGAARDHDTFLQKALQTKNILKREAKDLFNGAKDAERKAEGKLKTARTQCEAATDGIAALDSQQWWRREWEQRFGRARSDLLQTKATQCGSVARLKRAYEDARDERQKRARQSDKRAAAKGRAKAWVNTDLPIMVTDLRERALEEREKAERHFTARLQRFWDKYDVGGILKLAAIALAVMIVSPYVIRLFSYYVLAPAAMRRPSIRLAVPGGTGAGISPVLRSSTSVGVRLAGHEELLVRQDFLQTTSCVGEQKTQWLLDWRKPLTSFASGMTFLTRIRGAGETATVSAVHDPFAEVTILSLPEEASCVLQPRALAAVVQPIDQPLRVSTRWRLGSLNAWLTMQLRYVIFHGPVRLVVRGGRGVRIERAEQGRVFGQDQLIGFSANLAYSVTRTETFWPYFLGREQLMKDRVDLGDGVIILEEAPMAGRSAGSTRRGIEGLIDAGMKAFGV